MTEDGGAAITPIGEQSDLVEAALAVLDCFDSGLFTNYHEDECPEDSTCECEGTMILKQLQHAAVGKEHRTDAQIGNARIRAAKKGRAL